MEIPSAFSRRTGGIIIKQKLKMYVDVLMTLLLILLMAYQVTGDKLHEYCGAAMLVLFIIHHILNIKWYGSLLKGRYKAVRIFGTIVNFALLISMLCLGFSGIVMSRHVFAFLPIKGPMATARTMHMAASYWGFVLMGIHVGLHWTVVTGMFRRLVKGKSMSGWQIWLLRLAALAFAGYGAVCFVKANIISYMFLKIQFVFFDYEKSAGLVLLEYIAMMGMWTFISYYAAKGLKGISGAVKK